MLSALPPVLTVYLRARLGPRIWPSLAIVAAGAAVIGAFVLSSVLRGGVVRPDPAAGAVLQRAALAAEVSGDPGVLRPRRLHNA